jgi:nifR3 family TIM-barrel protein
MVAQPPSFLFLKDTDGDDKADVRETVFGGMWGIGDTHAQASNLHYGYDNWLYGAVGYSGFKGQVGADFVDLNFGCPVPKVVKKGGGSAMLKDLVAMGKVLSSVKKAVNIPVTIKIRTGWDQNTRNALEACEVSYNEGMTWVAIHGRTRAQGYSGAADWEFISNIKAKSKLPIIGNGDILTGLEAVERLRESGCDGVMIGRGALKNPLIFMEALKAWKNDLTPVIPTLSFREIFSDLKDLILTHCDDHIAQIQLRKFAAWFATGYPGASQFRKNIFQSKTTLETIDLANHFFAEIENLKQEDTRHDPFLMGGHG